MSKSEEDRRYFMTEDVQRRLHNSVVRYKGTLYFVESVSGLNVTMFPIGLKRVTTEDYVIIDSNDKDLDIKSLPLGYVEFNNGLFYLDRPPYRKQKQAVSPDNTVYFDMGTGRTNNTPVEMMRTRSFVNMVEDSYPVIPYEKWADILAKKGYHIISREYAVYRNELYYKNSFIGTYTPVGLRVDDSKVNSLILSKLQQLGIPYANVSK